MEDYYFFWFKTTSGREAAGDFLPLCQFHLNLGVLPRPEQTMAISQISFALLLLLGAAAFAVAPTALADGDDVLALTESTFEKEVGQDRGALVEFYAPWFAIFSFVSLDRLGI